MNKNNRCRFKPIFCSIDKVWFLSHFNGFYTKWLKLSESRFKISFF